MPLRDRRLILAVDPTSRGVAFVLFHRGEILDWGERTASIKPHLDLVSEMVEGWGVEALVLENADAPGSRRRPRFRRILRCIAKYAGDREVEVVAVSRAESCRAWRRIRARNKDEIAVEIAALFTEITPALPLARKASRSEHPRANIFDAASLAIYALSPSLIR